MMPGKLRVRCANCKGGSFVLERVSEGGRKEGREGGREGGGREGGRERVSE